MVRCDTLGPSSSWRLRASSSCRCIFNQTLEISVFSLRECSLQLTDASKLHAVLVERHSVISWLSVCLLSAGILSDVVYISDTYIAVGLKALYSDNITLLYIVYTDYVFCLGFKLVTFPGDCSLNTMINFLRNGGLDVFQCIGGHKLDNMVQSTATFCRAEGDRCAVYCVSQPTHAHTQYVPTWRVGLFVRSSWSRNVKKTTSEVISDYVIPSSAVFVAEGCFGWRGFSHFPSWNPDLRGVPPE